MIVCICQRVSDRDIVRVVRDGASSFEDLQIETGVASRCGCCRSCAQQIYDKACAEHGARAHAGPESRATSPAYA
ncbi:MAG TPA: (2Fe-2S)-binding protein [Caldimonas sp.]|jgi:bacterioferritin-associated ferredoxin|nr:(2Fe-2S)-binding protein [Caldimonas sp.]HEX2540122.1 (2Fe-2S)-binding protein [Caldimonas sp.]